VPPNASSSTVALLTSDLKESTDSEMLLILYAT
jgi:hypothetical protein